MLRLALRGEASPVDALDYCFVRYRTCRSLARWVASRLLGVDASEIDADSGQSLVASIERVVAERVQEESRDEPVSMRRLRIESEVARIVGLVIRVLASNYEGEEV